MRRLIGATVLLACFAFGERAEAPSYTIIPEYETTVQTDLWTDVDIYPAISSKRRNGIYVK